MLRTLSQLNMIIVIAMTVFYFYHVVYTVVGLFAQRRRRLPEAAQAHRFAALICARNESAVIAELVRSLKAQKYPQDKLDVYVLADNCTDDTGRAAKRAGALVYERRDAERVGKGYALDYLLKKIETERGRAFYDGYFVFDADNLVDEHFVAEMNKTFDSGYEVVTSYRNSKNFARNWITYSYAVWFLHEARFINYPRMLLGNGCAVSGTGFLVSSRVIRENGGWPFDLLTEDIQFSVDCAVRGRKIGYCDSAVVYDEQPETFGQSWDQRMRWAKGFYQVDARYLRSLAAGALTAKGRRMTCYDIMMTIAPGLLFSTLFSILNIAVLATIIDAPAYLVHIVLTRTGRFLLFMLGSAYLGLVFLALLTVVSEWKRIRTSAPRKLQYIAIFPLFMATYVPIALLALLKKVEWKPIRHFSAGDAELVGADRKN
ncbi:MAG: glycosyltransferase family 2 protein [Oscillospiraceae bacterium]|nr:glycosyltransferase family 2 protein [Oscillospiraceae bacterium]